MHKHSLFIFSFTPFWALEAEQRSALRVSSPPAQPGGHRRVHGLQNQPCTTDASPLAARSRPAPCPHLRFVLGKTLVESVPQASASLFCLSPESGTGWF